MMLLACGMCGGIIEAAVAGGGAVAASIVLTELYVRLASRKKATKNDRHLPPSTGSLKEYDGSQDHAQN